MSEFSGTAAVGAGFRLIRREPAAFLAWAVAYAIVGVLPQLWLGSTALTAMSAFVAMGENATANDPEYWEFQSRMMALQPVAWASSLVSAALLMGAAFRATLSPGDRRFSYLRLGAQELWLGLMLVILYVLYVIAVVVVALPIAILMAFGFASGADGGSAVVLLAFPLIAIGLGVIVWGALRLSLALPMSFADRNFRLPEAWSLSRGHAGKMFLVFAILAAIVFAAEMALLIAGFVAVAAATPLDELSRAWLRDPAAVIAGVSPATWALIVVFVSLFGAGALTVFSAALARICLDLRSTALAD